jgi:hypothetical protein
MEPRSESRSRLVFLHELDTVLNARAEMKTTEDKLRGEKKNEELK